jgi:hypothetical protein
MTHCIQKFPHSDYRSLQKQQNIYYCELLLQMEGDSDDEGTDSKYDYMSGHQLLWTTGEPCRQQLSTTKSTRDSFVCNSEAGGM